MAGDDISYRVVPDSFPDSSSEIRISYISRDHSIARDASLWDGEECFPDFQLESGSMEMELDLLLWCVATEKCSHFLMYFSFFFFESRIYPAMLEVE